MDRMLEERFELLHDELQVITLMRNGDDFRETMKYFIKRWQMLEEAADLLHRESQLNAVRMKQIDGQLYRMNGFGEPIDDDGIPF